MSNDKIYFLFVIVLANCNHTKPANHHDNTGPRPVFAYYDLHQNPNSMQSTLDAYRQLTSSLSDSRVPFTNTQQAKTLRNWILEKRINPLTDAAENEATDFTKNRLSATGFRLAFILGSALQLATVAYSWYQESEFSGT